MEVKSPLIEETEKLFNNPPNENSSLDLSMALLNTSILDKQSLYEKIKSKLLEAIKIKINESIENNIAIIENYEKPGTLAWILGRIVVAEDNIGNKENANNYAQLLETYLKKESTQKDYFAAWAWGYLLTYYAGTNDNKYFASKEHVNEITTAILDIKEKQLPLVLWVLVMNLQASASIRDMTLYTKTLVQAKSQTQKESLVDAIKEMPIKNYRAWALAIATYSDALMDFKIEKLVKATEDAIKEKDALPYDKLLAKTMLTMAKKIKEESTKKEEKKSFLKYNFVK